MFTLCSGGDCITVRHLVIETPLCTGLSRKPMMDNMWSIACLICLHQVAGEIPARYWGWGAARRAAVCREGEEAGAYHRSSNQAFMGALPSGSCSLSFTDGESGELIQDHEVNGK